MVVLLIYKVNHHAIFIKLMKRYIPVQLLEIIECLLNGCYSCVKWNNDWSLVFEINFGVRQGSVLSPFLADRTNGRAYAIHCCVCPSVCRL